MAWGQRGGVWRSGGQTSTDGAAGQTTTATSTAPGVCVPGISVQCACPSGHLGAQACTSAGTYAACVCAPSAVDAGSAGGRDGAADGPPDAAIATGGSGGTTVESSGGTINAGGTTTAGGSTSNAPSGTTVTFANGKAQGAITGYGWLALGAADALTDPTCGPGKMPITNTAPCPSSTNWNSPTALCVSGPIPALGTPPDYAGNWGIMLGVNSADPMGVIGQSFSTMAITVTGLPLVGLRAMVHKRGDPDSTSYCAVLTSGTAMPLAYFSTACYTPTSPGIAITAADVPNIDKIGVQVSSGAAAIAVTNLCITGITFAK